MTHTTTAPTDPASPAAMALGRPPEADGPLTLRDYVDRIVKARVYDVARVSPLERLPILSRRLGNTVLLKREAGLAKASGEPNREKVGKVTREQVRQIAELKTPDLNAADTEAAMRMIEGTARSMGIEVEG